MPCKWGGGCRYAGAQTRTWTSGSHWSGVLSQPRFLALIRLQLEKMGSLGSLVLASGLGDKFVLITRSTYPIIRYFIHYTYRNCNPLHIWIYLYIHNFYLSILLPRWIGGSCHFKSGDSTYASFISIRKALIVT